MNILILGDSHTYGLGLPAGQLSYVGHFIRQISRTGRAVSVDAYAHQTMEQVQTTLLRLPLNRYDLILLQVNPNHKPIKSMAPADLLPANWLSSPQRTQQPKPSGLARYHRLNAVINFFTINRSGWFTEPDTVVIPLLDVLRPYRHNVLLITPFACLNPVRHRMGRRMRTVLLHEAGRQLFSVFDSDSVVLPREEYFLTETADQLNGVGHELIGLALYDFYQSAPTIVTVQPARR